VQAPRQAAGGRLPAHEALYELRVAAGGGGGAGGLQAGGALLGWEGEGGWGGGVDQWLLERRGDGARNNSSTISLTDLPTTTAQRTRV